MSYLDEAFGIGKKMGPKRDEAAKAAAAAAEAAAAQAAALAAAEAAAAEAERTAAAEAEEAANAAIAENAANAGGAAGAGGAANVGGAGGSGLVPRTEEQQRLMTARSTAKRTLTKFRNRLLDKTEGVEEIEAGIEMVNQLYGEFCLAHKKVQATFSDPALAETDAEKYDDVIMDTKTAVADAKRTIRNIRETADQQRARREASLHQTAAEAAAAAVRGQGPKLSGVELSKFSGSYEKFPAWFSLFKALVDSRTSFDDTTKFGYLKAYTTGAAAATLARFEMVPSNYEPAKKLLEERFGKPRLIRKTVMKKLVEYQPSKDTAAEGRKTLDMIHGLIQTLQTVKIDTKSGDLAAALIPHLEEKFPDEARAEYEKWVCQEGEYYKPTLQKFCEEMDKALEPLLNRETKKSVPAKVTTKATALAAAPKEQGATNEGGKKKADGQKKKSPSEQKCVFCSSPEHKSVACPEGQKMTVDERWKKVNKQRACYLCLNTGHQTKACTVKPAKCPVENCDKMHNKLLHWDKQPA